MNKLSNERRAQIIRCLCEGNSVRSTCRITGAEKRTVLRLLVAAGKACADYHKKTVRNLKSRRIQADEIWSFIGMKEKTAKRKGDKRPKDAGDVWTWTAIDADSKLAVSWFVGARDGGAAYEFISDLESRLATRVQLTTDGNKTYLDAVDSTFGIGIDYAQLIKIYGEEPTAEKRYSPAICIGTERHTVCGTPDPDHISTSFVERANLTMRMHMRRFTRLTNGFSKKIENHAHQVALHFMFYNFARVHQTLRVTPAMEAKMLLPDGTTTAVADHVWTIDEIVALIPQEDVVILK